MSAKSSWLIVLFLSSGSLLIFCPIVLSIIESGELMFSTIIVEMSISPYSSVSFCFICFGTLLLGVYLL